jgi:hypothetical protein
MLTRGGGLSIIVIYFALTVELNVFRPSQMLLKGLAADDCGILASCLTVHIVHYEQENGKAIEEIARR